MARVRAPAHPGRYHPGGFRLTRRERGPRRTALAARPTDLTIDDPADRAVAARQLAAGGIVAHAFANFYVITTRGDADTVRRVNAVKSRPAGQVGSITGSPEHVR